MERVCLMAMLPKGSGIANISDKIYKMYPMLSNTDTSPPHITLMYFGSVPAEGIEIIKREIDNLMFRPIIVRSNHVTWFDSDTGVPVIVKYDKSPPIMGIQSKLELMLGGLRSADTITWPTYEPHTTIGYMPKGSVPASKIILDAKGDSIFSCTVDTLCLVSEGNIIGIWRPRANTVTASAIDNVSDFRDSLKSRYHLSRLYMNSMTRQTGVKSISIDMIEVDDDYRRQGMGTAAIKEILRWADDNGYIVVLTPSTDKKRRPSESQLKRWYKSLGFTRNTDHRFSYSMIRMPTEHIMPSHTTAIWNPMQLVSYAWMEPNGTLHELRKGTGHSDWSESNKGKSPRDLVADGWVAMSSPTDFSTYKQTIPDHTIDGILKVIVDNVIHFDPDRRKVFRVWTYGNGGMESHTVSDWVSRYGGRKWVEALYERKMSIANAIRNITAQPADATDEDGETKRKKSRHSDPFPPEFRNNMKDKGKVFTNPDTGNKVVFDSLPWKEQLKQYKSWLSSHSDGITHKERQKDKKDIERETNLTKVDRIHETDQEGRIEDKGDSTPPDENDGGPDISPRGVRSDEEPDQTTPSGDPAATGNNLHPDTRVSFGDIGDALKLSDEEKKGIQDEIYTKDANSVDAEASTFRDNVKKFGIPMAILIMFANLGMQGHKALQKRVDNLIGEVNKVKEGGKEFLRIRREVIDSWKPYMPGLPNAGKTSVDDIKQKGHDNLDKLQRHLQKTGQSSVDPWDSKSVGELQYIVRGEWPEGKAMAESWTTRMGDNNRSLEEGVHFERVDTGDGPQAALIGGAFNDLDWFISQHNADLFYRDPEDAESPMWPLKNHFGGNTTSVLSRYLVRATSIPRDGNRYALNFYGMDDGEWMETNEFLIGPSRREWDWEMVVSLASRNEWRNYSVTGATESHRGFQKALTQIVAKYPELRDFIISFDGPYKPIPSVMKNDADSSVQWRQVEFLHGTDSSLLPSIKKHGLRPRSGTGSAPTHGAGVGATPGNPDAVYLTTQRNMATFAAYDAAGDRGGDPIILVIKGIDGAKVGPDEDSREHTAEKSLDRTGAIAYFGTIYPHMIDKVLVLENGTWRDTRLGHTHDDDLVTLYHETTPEAADAIIRTKKWVSKADPNYIYFTTHPGGQAGGRGSGLVTVRVPRQYIELDDEFPSGEQHYSIHKRNWSRIIISEVGEPMRNAQIHAAVASTRGLAVLIYGDPGMRSCVLYDVAHMSLLTEISSHTDIRAAIRGYIIISDSQDCTDNVYEVNKVVGDKGYGPLLYDMALALARMDDMLGVVPDRKRNTPGAVRIWEYYANNRSDVHSVDITDISPMCNNPRGGVMNKIYSINRIPAWLGSIKTAHRALTRRLTQTKVFYDAFEFETMLMEEAEHIFQVRYNIHHRATTANARRVVSTKVDDKIPGGMADKYKNFPQDLINEVSKKHSIPEKDIPKLMKQYNKAIKDGINVEMEHTTSKEKAAEIARDHLVEWFKEHGNFIGYYNNLKKMEKKGSAIDEALNILGKRW